jgi:hypothetical protein
MGRGAKSVDADATLKAGFTALQKNRWKNYDTKVAALKVDMQKVIDRKTNEIALIGLLKTRPTLNGTRRLNYIDKAKKDNIPVAEAEIELGKMLAARRKPGKRQVGQNVEYGQISGR